MNYKSLLNEKQYEAVTTSKQHVRVIAGAGSGKTRVLTYRISYLLNEVDVAPWNILAITFTNKVAKEMKSRVLKLNPDLSLKGLFIQTYHAFCTRFLRSEIEVLGYNRNFTILDEEDQLKLIKTIVSDDGKKKNDPIIKMTVNYISHQKCIGLYPWDIVITRPHFQEETTCLSYYQEYEERIRAMQALDFDDLLLKTKQILEDYPDIRAKWQGKLEHILIDEFQDTNDIQYQLIKLLKSPTCSLFVVGDPDQTIYSWRGANQRIILDIEKDFQTTTYILNENYRSTQKILDVANRLISKNELRVKKDLFTENQNGDDIVTHKAFRADDEANWVIGEILKLKNDNPDFKYKDVTLLYRSAYLTLPFEKALMNKRIPYVIYAGLRFYQRKEIKDVLAYFNLMTNRADDLAFLRIMNVPRRSIGEKTQEQIRLGALASNQCIWDYLRDCKTNPSDIKLKTVMTLNCLMDDMDKTKQELQDNNEAYSSVLEKFITDIHYYEYLVQEDDEGSDDRIKNVKSLFDDIKNFIKDNPESKFEEYLQNVALLSAQDEIEDKDAVTLMTVHTAKGLEFPYVFLVGLNEGVFPSQRTMDESPRYGLEEERRLCYVAFTRAMKKLFVTCNQEYSYTLGAAKTVSRFFKDAGLQFVSRPFATINDDDGFPKASLYAIKKPADAPTRNYSQPKAEAIEWHVGDILSHDNFGEGKVVGVDGNLIIVEFNAHGRKTMVGNHIKLHLVKKGGFEA